jgi:hypothetical protein
MEPLRGQDAGDPKIAFAARLLASRSPTVASTIMQERVRRRIKRRPRKVLTVWLLRPAIALSILLLAGFASARFAPALVRALTVIVRPPSHAAPRSSAIAAPIVTPPSPVVAPTVTPSPAPVIASHRKRPARVAIAAPTEAVTPQPDESAEPIARPTQDVGASLMTDAFRALRQDRNPTQAAAFARQYLQRFAGGPLAEEAFAIALEASIATHAPDAATARAYLHQFPGGRFDALAKEIIDQK